MVIDAEKVMGIIMMKGPVLPAQIAKGVDTSLLFASAVLSELVSLNRLRVSKVKIGSSPLYYAPGQEPRLQEFAGHLHEKEKKAYDLLKQKIVIRDKDADPVVRVALRNMKDYAVPLNVTTGAGKELFWKWYISKNEELEPLIKSMLGIMDEPKAEKAKVQEEVKVKTIIPSNIQTINEKISNTEFSKEVVKEEIKPVEKEKNIKKEAPKKEIKTKNTQKPSEFLQNTTSYLSNNNIMIIEREVLKKGKEIDFIVQIESVFGLLTYYCKAKDKQRISESDLSAAYVQGQLKKLPVIFLTKGDPTKKAKEMLSRELKTIVFKKL